MESKLKALKVADLKEILKKASVSAPPRATKADLIARIIAEPAAVDAYNALHNAAGVTPQQDASSKPIPAAKPKAPARQPPVSPTKVQDSALPQEPASTNSTTDPAGSTTGDSELEKRKARAARFGIPLVDSSHPAPKDKESKKKFPEDEGKLKARAERFGTEVSADSQNQPRKKRGAAEDPADPEELKRRRKRAERFGLPLAGTSEA
ncbi:hypothetical protein BJ322DRAFT_1030333 [Thelephora terrestris]|uniref:THO1-MOS11 C-terminal domain-containing protein n=1 Tax=Thelephora terrestris TaxID=56493 RepID=A0A9P6HRL4_9AGAM|nr:hypothetical protein BJ322DRAFT_1030333 [Thelephora terrestris]